MRIAYFTHSLAACWNHGNAHFLRGTLRELIALGHDVRAFEPEGNWSLANLLSDAGEDGLAALRYVGEIRLNMCIAHVRYARFCPLVERVQKRAATLRKTLALRLPVSF